MENFRKLFLLFIGFSCCLSSYGFPYRYTEAEMFAAPPVIFDEETEEIWWPITYNEELDDPHELRFPGGKMRQDLQKSDEDSEESEEEAEEEDDFDDDDPNAKKQKTKAQKVQDLTEKITEKWLDKLFEIGD